MKNYFILKTSFTACFATLYIFTIWQFIFLVEFQLPSRTCIQKLICKTYSATQRAKTESKFGLVFSIGRCKYLNEGVRRCFSSNLCLTFDRFPDTQNGHTQFSSAFHFSIYLALSHPHIQIGYVNRFPIRHNSILITFSLINMLIILHSNYREQSSGVILVVTLMFRICTDRFSSPSTYQSLLHCCSSLRSMSSLDMLLQLIFWLLWE